MPIDDLRAEGLSNVTKASQAFRQTLPADLQSAYDEAIGSRLSSITKTTIDTVAALDTLNDPEAPAVNDPEAVRRATLSDGQRRVSEARRLIDRAVDNLAQRLGEGAIPAPPSDSAKVALARQTVEQVLGPPEGRNHRSVTALERLIDDGDPTVAGVLLASSWGRAVIDSIPMADRTDLEARAFAQAAAGKYGSKAKGYTKAMGRWAELRRAISEAGTADVVLGDLERKANA